MDNPIEALIKSLRDGDSASRQQVVHTLAEADTHLIEALVATLEHNPDVELRQGTAVAFTQLQDARVVPSLIAALEHDTDPEVRIFAAQALAVQRDARAVEPLIAALNDPEPAVCEEVVRALGELGEVVDGTRIVEALAGALIDLDWGTRQSAAEMLIRLDADPGGQAEKLLLTDLNAENTEVRLGAAASMVELSDDRALETLTQLLHHNDVRIVSSAAMVLGKLGDQRAVVPLTAVLTHRDEFIRSVARNALHQLGH